MLKDFIYFICVYQDWILHRFVNTENSMYMHSISILNKWVRKFAYMYILSYNRNIYLIKALVYLKVVEGAAGTALGAYLKNPGRFKGKRVVLIACGGNLGIQTLKQLVSMYTWKRKWNLNFYHLYNYMYIIFTQFIPGLQITIKRFKTSWERSSCSWK